MATGIKNSLYAYCGKQKITPKYTVKACGGGFVSEVRVANHDYVGTGVARNKKSAQTAAALDFCRYLSKEKSIIIPGAVDIENSPLLQHEDRPCYQDKKICNQDSGYERVLSSNNKRKAEQLLDVDVLESPDLAVNGYWTLHNSRPRLNEYLQKNNLSNDFKYFTIGSDDEKRFRASFSIYIDSLAKVTAAETGFTKEEAAQLCCLSVVRQLYCLKEIESYTPSRKSKINPSDRNSVGASNTNTKFDGTGFTTASFTAEDETDIVEIRNRDEKSVMRRENEAIPHYLTTATNNTDSSHTVSDTGNWTMENSRPKLNIYLQKNKLPLNFDYTSNGPDHLRTYTASMTITIKHLGKVITGSGSGPTKKQANRMCSLSLVGQLYRLGEIEAYFSELTDTTKEEEQNAGPFDFRVSDSILSSLRNITTLFEFCPQENNKPSESTLFESPRQFKVGQNDCGTDSVITWRSPSVSWNPWTNCEISINSNKNTTNKQLFTEQQRKLKFEPALQQRILERQSLPISRSAVRILDAIDCNPVVIICGMTGCGKTTQVPQFVVDDMIGRERGSDCAVIVTQPQRICTISIAERVAYERCEVLGESVGYCVKFEKLLPRPHASILFCTSDVLLRRMESGLRGVSHVIIDEIHERDLKTDVLLLILRDMIRTYPTLKVVLMSATADNDDISSYFGKCPIINITEKCYSVTEYFLEDCVTLIEPQANVNADSPLYEASSKEFILIENLLCYVVNLNVSGNILIFLPDWNAISTLYHLLKNHKLFGTNKFLLLPLHSQISREAQRDIFNVNKAGITKVILSTDIAESSITIRDVVFVIDSAKTTIKRYCARDNSCSFETIWASKSALKQRRGRAGRTRPGYCFHLCTTDQYTKLPQYLVPEILRSPLHEVILILKLLSLGNPATILKRALQPPSLEAIEVAISFLIGIGAITRMIEFTDVGLILSKLPIEPRLGRMIILSCIFKCANAACIIAVADSLPEPFVIRSIVDGPTYLHKQFSSKRYSDHIAVLGAFQAWQRARNAGIDSEENFCKNHGLSVSALRLIYEAKNWLIELLIHTGFSKECFSRRRNLPIINETDLNNICALLCIGFYPNVCVYNKNNKLRMNNEQFAQIHTSSINYNCKSFPYPFFTYSEKIHAEVIYLKHLTVISPLHLLLFGCQRITWKDDLVLLDDWIALRMPREVACMIISIRQILEMLAIRTASSPMVANRLEDNYERAVQLTQQLFTESFELHSNLRSIRGVYTAMNEIVTLEPNTINRTSNYSSSYTGKVYLNAEDL